MRDYSKSITYLHQEMEKQTLPHQNPYLDAIEAMEEIMRQNSCKSDNSTCCSKYREQLKEIIMKFYDIPNDTYAYNLTRVKEAFYIGTVSINDFDEFTEENIDELVDYIVEQFKKTAD